MKENDFEIILMKFKIIIILGSSRLWNPANCKMSCGNGLPRLFLF